MWKPMHTAFITTFAVLSLLFSGLFSGDALAGKSTASAAAKRTAPAASAPAPKKAKVTTVTVSKSQHPQSAQHIQDAQNAGHPKTLTVNRGGAKSNRAASLKGVKTQPNKDRDEYPPAMFKEGGKGASVRHIDSSDNRGAGSCIGAQCRKLKDGDKVKIKVVK
jgi:filamentous hemagglutinin